MNTTLRGSGRLSTAIRENQADKLGLYAFDDVDDIALMAAPGCNVNQQREMLELCEVRKDRFALLRRDRFVAIDDCDLVHGRSRS